MLNVTLKYFFGQTKIKYLGFWVTREGINPVNNKIEAITNMMSPEDRKGVHELIFLVTYSQYVCTKWLIILQTLNKLVSTNVKLKWNDIGQNILITSK